MQEEEGTRERGLLDGELLHHNREREWACDPDVEEPCCYLDSLGYVCDSPVWTIHYKPKDLPARHGVMLGEE